MVKDVGQKLTSSFATLLFAVLTAVACQSNVDSTRIAFSSMVDSTQQIYLMEADGTNITQLTSDSAANYCPVWAPDGQRIAFISKIRTDEGQAESISILDVEGANLVQLISEPAQIYNLAWSPDGQYLAFSAAINSPPSIFVVDSDGSNLIQLTDAGVDSGNNYAPAWSPDSRHIAFASNRGFANGTNGGYDDFNIFVMDINGSNLTQLTNDVSNDQTPAWSPDGRHIAFASSPCTSPCNNGQGWVDFDIYVMDSDGSNITQLTRGPSHDFDPAWSPDGGRIAFMSSSTPYTCLGEACDSFDIYVMDADGTNVMRLTNSGNNTCPAWEP